MEASLLSFTEYFFSLRGDKFIRNQHHIQIEEALQKVERGEINNLLINCPPRYTKTELVVINWIAQSIGRNPKAKFIHLSYSDDLALDNSAKAREIVKSPEFQALWSVELKADSDSKKKWYTTQGGGVYATAAGGAVTGFGAGATGDDGDDDKFYGCFVGSTKITTDNGLKRIDELHIGDKVLTYNHQTSTLQYECVVATKEQRKNAIIEIKTYGGRTIYCTPCHRFFNGTSYEPISKFSVGDRVVSHTRPAIHEMRSMLNSFSEIQIGSYKINNAWAKDGVLHSEMLIITCKGVRKIDKLASKRLLNLLKIIQATQSAINYMLYGLQKFTSFSQNEGGRKFKLSEKSQRLFGFIQEAKTSNQGKRWRGVCSLRVSKEVDSASYRPRENKQHGRKSYNSLPFMPHDASQFSGDTISSIREYSHDETSVYDIQTERNHNFFAEGVLVHNCIIIDDPLKPDDARSESVRNHINERLNNTIKSRRNSRRTPIVIIMQRLHEDDMSGFVLQGKMGEEFHHLKLKALDDNQALWPLKHTVDELLAMKEHDRTTFATQYQQEPVPDEGSVYRLPWFPRYNALPQSPTRTMVVHSWDTAYKAGEHNDPSVCCVFHVTPSVYYLAEVITGRWEYPELRRKVFDLANRDKPDAVLIEDKASGQSLIQELKQATTHAVIALKPDTDKETRARTTAAQVESGKLMLPNNASWLNDYEHEMMMFPHGKHDDMVDATSQFLKWMKERGGDSTSEYLQLMDRLGY